ncbi:hypothetical protein MA16_Dca002262 [Dendrobium catenatum]|uniref:Reverse transcriptase domain-containing protein n=1 Tax=Dendrobium catenatum TaxID=906689 RepID=A0A2I0W006_9ASPA|nr:hypothetical protein MA16_Dca002262 [Dendrobium catenatum]
MNNHKFIRKDFELGNEMLLFNSRLEVFSEKLNAKWSSPFTIIKVYSYGAIDIRDSITNIFIVNGERLKSYLRSEIVCLKSFVEFVHPI